jgi:hypothetical protein
MANVSIHPQVDGGVKPGSKDSKDRSEHQGATRSANERLEKDLRPARYARWSRPLSLTCYISN